MSFSFLWDNCLFKSIGKWSDSIQFILYSPISEICLECFTICTPRHPCPRTSHRIRKNSQEIEKTLSRAKKCEETFRRPTEEDASPGWTEAIDVMCTEGIITEFKHMQWTDGEQNWKGVMWIHQEPFCAWISDSIRCSFWWDHWEAGGGGEVLERPPILPVRGSRKKQQGAAEQNSFRQPGWPRSRDAP